MKNAPMADPTCDVCGATYVRKLKNQRYCSRVCYKRSYYKNNPEKVRERGHLRRKKKPEWYAKNEWRYYRTHRTKVLKERPWKYLLQSARRRAKEKGLPYELSNDWAGHRWTGCCEITGVAFAVNGARGPHPFSPSIDRKDPKLGYTQENTRFVLWGCNAIKGVGTDADMLAVARAIVANFPST